MKADLPKREPERLARWEATDLYGRVRKARAGAPRFILHDGPPYANGEVHIGTAMNKILKDLVVRSKSLAGFDAPYVPGWDCHGLPIELKVDKELGPKKRTMSDVEIRKACRRFAEKWIDNQRSDFRRLGILGTWDSPYRTMDFGYQASIAKAFGEFVDRGLVTFGFKSVLWCVHDRTALAEAEIEYEEKLDPSIYVAFPIEENDASKRIWGDDLLRGKKIFAVIWTTTPWTLPANRAIVLGKEIDYVLAQRASDRDALYVIAEPLVAAVAGETGWSDLSVLPLSRKRGAEIAEARPSYRRPFDLDGTSFGFLLGEHVSTTDGTGLVHTAPGHGRDDYEVVKRHGFKVDDPALCPVDEGGFYDGNAPEMLRGKRVVRPRTPAEDAGAAVMAALARTREEALAFAQRADRDHSGCLLLSQKTVPHSYPHCWRCKNPVIFRATHQWFIDLHALREKALSEIHDRVRWIPPFGENRIGAMVENRLEWTISRQRRWGSPITFLRCTACAEKGVISHYPSPSRETADDRRAREDFFERVYRLFRERGADAWYDDAFPPSYFLGKSSSFSSCSSCGGTSFEKLRDILDVWFDSGVSHFAVLRSGDYGIDDPYKAVPPVPVMYLEGHDQHRGWFQSSLLTSVALTGRAPYDIVATHGFVLIGDGKKMSKSAGNTVSPQDVMSKDGADVLRFFVAQADYTDDVWLNPEILTGAALSYRKIRNTARFLLSNLFDFEPRHAVPDAALEPLDRWILDRAARLANEAKLAYERYEFHAVARRLLEFATTDLSAIWCDIRKDAFYVLAANDPVRRSAQTAAAKLAETVALLLSPICPFTAEEIWENIPGREEGTLFFETYECARLPRLESPAVEAWERLLLLRGVIQNQLEPLRRDGKVGSSAQAAVEIAPNAELDADLARVGLPLSKLAEFLNMPEVVRVNSAPEGPSPSLPFYGGISLLVRPAEGVKCPRCWQVRRDVEPGGVCARCRWVIGPEPVQSAS